MKKLRIYLDTSVISFLDAHDSPEKRYETLKLWDKFKSGELEAVLSTTTLKEIDQCEKQKRETLLNFLREIDYTVINVDDKLIALAEKFIEFNILKEKSLDDCLHISAAIIHDCDIIVSWNFKHIVNHKTIQGVKVITALEGFKSILIYSPTILIAGDELS